MLKASRGLADSNSWFPAAVSNASGTLAGADAVWTVAKAPAVVARGIRVVQANLGIVTAAGKDAAGNILFAQVKVVRNDSVLFLRKMSPDSAQFDHGAEGVSIAPFPFLGLPESSLGWGGSVFDADGNCLQAMSTYTAGGRNTPRVLNGGVISKVSPDGKVALLVHWSAGSASAMAPAGLAIGPDGVLYFIDQLSGNLVAWTARDGARALARLRPPLRGSFPGPLSTHIAVAQDNRVYVMDRNLLKRVDGADVTIVAGGAISPFPGHLPFVPGSGTSAGSPGTTDGAGRAARFFAPTAMAADAQGNLLVADLTTLRKVTPAGVVTTVAGIPAPSQVPDANFPPLQEGPLTSSLGLRITPITAGADGVVHAFVHPTAANYPARSANVQQTLVKIRLS